MNLKTPKTEEERVSVLGEEETIKSTPNKEQACRDAESRRQHSMSESLGVNLVGPGSVERDVSVPAILRERSGGRDR